METMTEVLRIVAGSWPLAAMVVGVSAAVVIRRSFHQMLANKRLEQIDRDVGNRSVVVQRDRYSDDG